MSANARHWSLYFDGAEFRLEPRSDAKHVAAKNRVIEEGLATILFHWGDELLPGPRLHMLGRSIPIVREQDLLAVDDLGRIHVFELKKDSTQAKSLFQLVSYLVQRPQNDGLWVENNVASTLWYGEQSVACKLAGLVCRERVENLKTEAPAGARQAERLAARLRLLADIARERTGLDLSPEVFRRIAGSLLIKSYGETWAGPLQQSPAKVLEEVVRKKLSPYWRVGLTRPGIVAWMVAPNVEHALEAAQPLLDRGLEIRCVSVDAREIIPGHEWGITVDEPENHTRGWFVTDGLAHLLQQAVDQHLAACPAAADRLRLKLSNPPRRPDKPEQQKVAALGWRATGGAQIELDALPDQVQWRLYYDWWTEGQALQVRDAVHKVMRNARAGRPKSWS
ncbi:MAG: hypothetical protein KKA73_18245, partial [Chloroflexi bacterium]|nr:hypothetical protein [Chloroflexota bacterium]